jgi:hypothetical protein
MRPVRCQFTVVTFHQAPNWKTPYTVTAHIRVFMVSLAPFPCLTDLMSPKINMTVPRRFAITVAWILHCATLYLRMTFFSFVTTVTVESKNNYFITKTINLVFPKLLHSHICVILTCSNLSVLWYMSSVLHPGSNDPTQQKCDGDLVILKAIWGRQNNSVSLTSLSFIPWLLPSIT